MVIITQRVVIHDPSISPEQSYLTHITTISTTFALIITLYRIIGKLHRIIGYGATALHNKVMASVDARKY